MFGFMIKKAFFDYWDNFFHFSVLNLAFIFSMLIPLGLPVYLLEVSPVLSLAVMILGLFWVGIFTAAASVYIASIADYRTPEPVSFFSNIREHWKSGVLFSAIWGVVLFVAYTIVPFYAGLGNLYGLAALAFLFWTFVIFALSVQFYFPVYTRLDKDLKKVLKKMFIIFFDNTLFAIALFLLALTVFAVSGFTAFLLFGPAGALLLGQVGLKLRLYKYDYMEENPGANRRKIPWRALTSDDRHRVGQRSLRGMIFPWKD
jgi:MFS family permease